MSMFSQIAVAGFPNRSTGLAGLGSAANPDGGDLFRALIGEGLGNRLNNVEENVALDAANQQIAALGYQAALAAFRQAISAQPVNPHPPAWAYNYGYMVPVPIPATNIPPPVSMPPGIMQPAPTPIIQTAPAPAGTITLPLLGNVKTSTALLLGAGIAAFFLFKD